MTTIIPEIPRTHDVHEQTGVDMRSLRVIPGEPPVTMCPLNGCFAAVPIKCMEEHLNAHADRGERL